MKTRKASIHDLSRMIEIEESATPGYGYIFENKEFYFDGIQNQGEMILALKDELPVGMGQYSILPDGSGWLEILRVHKDYQRQGAGNAIYNQYMNLAQKTNAPSIAMFTGRRNIASKTLAEKYGFTLAEAHEEYSLNLSDSCIALHDFDLLKDSEAFYQHMLKHSWGTFIALNRTFFHINQDTCKYLCDHDMVYTDGFSVVVVGCRMLKHRGYYIGYLSGNPQKCIEFAIKKTKQENLSKLTVSLPENKKELASFLEENKFTFNAELIVMEKKCASLENQN